MTSHAGLMGGAHRKTACRTRADVSGDVDACISAARARLDFVDFAFYVEATLTAPATTVGNPAEIAVVKVVASAAFSG